MKVNEQGKEVAAITALSMGFCSALSVEKIIYEMKVNRPFLFLLKSHKLSAGHNLLFISKIEKFE